jgi:Na+(H+)/acetate symporter ActP
MDAGALFVGFAIGLASVFGVTLMLATILTHDAAEHARRSATGRRK